MKECFVEKAFNETATALISASNAVLSQYAKPVWPHDASDRVHQLMGQLAAKELDLQRQREALQSCLDVLLRMIPDYCRDACTEPCLDNEHDTAIALAPAVLSTADMRAISSSTSSWVPSASHSRMAAASVS